MDTRPGNTTPTDSRSQRIRASRGGGQLLTRAHGSWNDIGLPAPTCTSAPVPDGRTIHPQGLFPRGSAADATYFIPGTNAIESTFATVRLRTNKTKGSGSRTAGLAMAYKLLTAAQARWRSVNAAHLVALVRAGATFVDGLLIEREDQRYAA